MPLPLPIPFSEHRPHEVESHWLHVKISSPLSLTLSLQDIHSSLLQCLQHTMPFPLPFFKQGSQDASPHWLQTKMVPPLPLPQDMHSTVSQWSQHKMPVSPGFSAQEAHQQSLQHWQTKTLPAAFWLQPLHEIMLRRVRQSTDTAQIAWLKTCAVGKLQLRRLKGMTAMSEPECWQVWQHCLVFGHCSPQTGHPSSVGPPSAPQSPECLDPGGCFFLVVMVVVVKGKGKGKNVSFGSCLYTPSSWVFVWRKETT